MSPERSFTITARLGLATLLVMFGLIVVGSVVRTTGSGLACPDWPLCNGQLIPPFEFHVMIEWFHRLLALVVSLLLAATVGSVVFSRPVRSRLAGLALVAVLMLAAQVMLGALTVWKLLNPAIVGAHLAVALLLFATVLVLTLVAQSHAGSTPTLPRVALSPRPAGLLAIFGIATAMVYGQAVLGGIVSTNHAGLACPDWPTCNGEWFPALEGLVGLQMLHRYGAYAVVAMMVFAFFRSRSAQDAGVRAGASMLLSFTLTQVVLGVFNVFLATPVWLSAAHLATAAAMLAISIIVTFRVASMPATATVLAAEAR